MATLTKSNFPVSRLKISDKLKESIRQSILRYKKAGIIIELLAEDTVKITQARLINGYVLNNKQLYERAKEVFADAGVFKIIPVVYSLDAEDITPGWIEEKMKEFGIHRNDLIKQLALDKSAISLYLSSGRGLTRTAKAAFFYYFLTYELNRDLRAQLM